ncbi:MAG: TlyA family RNA methyltransferase [Lactobacillales bacterium]|jgi:23S rRNA (cytidine1920-2'-O)/16S rRNA (cytidine1409-2'-O)-methyltransferase|nr:TlyA family RNA methyltransferase [Lactobacillales bacterium]
MPKERVDVLAFNQGLFETREKAKRGVMAGIVVSEKNGERYDKPGEKIDDATELRIKGETLKYVSRGGLKLEKALQVFDIDLEGRTVLDIGSSTGGFTDVSLQSGAKMVYALDVGTNQLAWKLRQDERVVVMEQTNFRYSELKDFPERPDFSCIDVSFISLGIILPNLFQILKDDGEVVALIKPQFEAGRELVGKKGIVRDAKVHEDVVEQIAGLARGLGFATLGLDYSPIRGGAGNIEFLLYLKKGGKSIDLQIAEIVKKAHEL